MPEEIVDLTGSRVIDERYANNVIFDEGGLDELLAHIKNYPVTNISYVSENDVDILSQLKVQENYTEGTPCVKVTFGNSEDISGNLSYADQNRILLLQQQAARILQVKDIYNRYSSLENEYISLIENVQTELKNIIINICNIYHNYLSNENGEFQGSYYDIFDTDQAKQLFRDIIYPADGNDCFYYKISFSVENIKDRVEDYIKSDSALAMAQFYQIIYGLRTTTGAASDLINPPVNKDSNNFYIIPLMKKQYDESVNNGAAITEPEDISKILWTGKDLFDSLSGTWVVTEDGENVERTDIKYKLYDYNNLLMQMFSLLSYNFELATSYDENETYYATGSFDQGLAPVEIDANSFDPLNHYIRVDNEHIRNLLKRYVGYIRDCRVQKYEEIRTFLVQLGDTAPALKQSVEVYGDESSNYGIVATYIDSNYLTDKREEEIEEEIQAILDSALEGKYTKVTGPQSENDEAYDYYYINEISGRYTKISLTPTEFDNFDHGDLYKFNEYQVVDSEDLVYDGSVTYYYKNENDEYVVYSGDELDSALTYYIHNYPATYGYKYVKVGSNIKFKDTEGNNVTAINSDTHWDTGTFRVQIDSKQYQVPIMGLAGGTGAIRLSGHLLPSEDSVYDIGGDTDAENKIKWRSLYLSNSLGGPNTNDYIPNAYITTINTHTSDNKASPTDSSIAGDTGYFNTLYINGNEINATNLNKVVNGSSDTTKKFWRGDCNWSDTLEGPFTVTGKVSITNTTELNSSTPNAALIVSGGIYAAKNIYGAKVFNAVFNDYAEYRTTINLTPGHVVIDNDDGSLSCSSQRLQPGAQIISDTFGHSMGKTDNAKTPIAVAGRVLAYTYQPRENYHAGMAVCSAPDGTIDIMTREEIRDYPDCIIGIVSEIPQYEYWGSDNVKVNNRIWIKIK